MGIRGDDVERGEITPVAGAIARQDAIASCHGVAADEEIRQDTGTAAASFPVKPVRPSSQIGGLQWNIL